MKLIIVNQKERVGAWVAERTGRTCPYSAFEAFGVEQDGVLIGGFIVDNYVKNARATIHAAGEGKRWVSRELLFAMFDYVFRQLNCRVLVNSVNVSNTASMIGTRKLGFTEVHRIPNGAGDSDLAIFVMQKQACRWLDFRRG